MPRRRDFAGRVVVVTGAGGGIGRAIARRFAKAGARLALLDVDGGAAKALAAELEEAGTPCLAAACDVTSEPDCGRAIDAAATHFGGLDVLFANAGITQRSLFAHTDAEVFRRVMDVNFFGSLYCTQAALPRLLESRGLVVVTSSIAGLAPLVERSGYCASKHALHGLFESLRCELDGSGVDVMMVCPGFTATGIGRAALDGSGRPARHPQSMVGSVSTPEEVADAIFHAATHGRRLLVLSAVGRLTALLVRVAPGLYERMMTRSIRRQIEATTG